VQFSANIATSSSTLLSPPCYPSVVQFRERTQQSSHRNLLHLNRCASCVTPWLQVRRAEDQMDEIIGDKVGNIHQGSCKWSNRRQKTTTPRSVAVLAAKLACTENGPDATSAPLLCYPCMALMLRIQARPVPTYHECVSRPLYATGWLNK